MQGIHPALMLLLMFISFAAGAAVMDFVWAAKKPHPPLLEQALAERLVESGVRSWKLGRPIWLRDGGSIRDVRVDREVLLRIMRELESKPAVRATDEAIRSIRKTFAVVDASTAEN